MSDETTEYVSPFASISPNMCFSCFHHTSGLALHSLSLVQTQVPVLFLPCGLDSLQSDLLLQGSNYPCLSSMLVQGLSKDNSSIPQIPEYQTHLLKLYYGIVIALFLLCYTYSINYKKLEAGSTLNLSLNSQAHFKL